MIEFQRVSKVYTVGSEKVHALREVDFHMHAGSFTAVMGASGSGKSTMMNIIGCLDRPTSGKYSLDSNDVSTLGERDLAKIRREKIGFVFQSFNLLSRATALENVEMPLIYSGRKAKYRRQRAREALDQVGLGDRALHRPNELSGGQMQRVAIARALVNEPLLILADEPTGALDSATGTEVMELFSELHQRGISILVVTHAADVATYAETIVHFRDGEIVKREFSPGNEVAVP